MDEKGLGHRLQLARQKAGLTQQGLCQKANLSYSTLAKIERGAIKSPSIFTIECIAEALGVTLDELIGRQPKEPQDKPDQHSRSGLRFVYFDVNGCLVRSYHRAFEKLAHDSGQPADVVETLFWHYNDQVCRGDLPMQTFNTELAKHLHVDSVNWANYYIGAIEPMPLMNELVRWASEHYGVGLLTNIMPGLLNTMRERGLIPNIDYRAVVDSSVVGAIKPEAKIYQVAIEQAHLKPNEILLIDDSRANIMAAEKMGFHVLWFDDSRPEESAHRIKHTLQPVTEDSHEERVAPTSLPVQPEAGVEKQLDQLPELEPGPVIELESPAASPSVTVQTDDIPAQW